MKYMLPLIVMFMAILMIVCTREESIKYGTMIFGVCCVWLFIVNKLKPSKKEITS